MPHCNLSAIDIDMYPCKDFKWKWIVQNPVKQDKTALPKIQSQSENQTCSSGKNVSCWISGIQDMIQSWKKVWFQTLFRSFYLEDLVFGNFLSFKIWTSSSSVFRCFWIWVSGIQMVTVQHKSMFGSPICYHINDLVCSNCFSFLIF